jgi:hypothetical protein
MTKWQRTPWRCRFGVSAGTAGSLCTTLGGTVRAAGSPDIENGGARLAVTVGVARNAAQTSRSPSQVASTLTEADLLIRLSDVSVNLRRLRQDETTAIAESASDLPARGMDWLGPLRERLSKAIAELESEAEHLRSQLSPATSHALETLFRRKVVPLVATLDRGACGVCHLRLPTALASSTALRGAVHRCPHCKRIVVPASSDEPATARATNSPDRGR